MTIKDIAKQCGVSISTVSRVLNNRPDVSEENRRKVLSVIESSNYIPNNSARDLVKTKSEAIGLVVRGVSNPFFTYIIRAIEEEITAMGGTMVMQQIGISDDEVKCGAMMERDKRLRGIIFLGGRSDYSPSELAAINVPFVCCSYANHYGTLDEKSYSSVSIADEDEAYRAVKTLYDAGHRRIAALISTTDDHAISQLRYQGYVKALNDCGLALDEELVISAGTFFIRDAYQATAAKLAQGCDFTALFAISDNMAMGAMRALREAGRKVPEDCSVIGIDGIGLSNYCIPTLTTMVQPAERMGCESVSILLDMVEHGAPPRQIHLDTVLRQGGSVRAI
jgi:LacI family transcriptional regulator